MGIKKIRRILRRKIASVRGKFAYYKLPLFRGMQLELQSSCNRECSFCPRQGDDSGKRLDANGRKIDISMPTEHVMKVLDEAHSLGFKNFITFHHLSEPFLDERIIDMANEAKKRGMIPYVNTNGDILKSNDELCNEARKVFRYFRIGLYDCLNQQQAEHEMNFWKEKLKGSRVVFSWAKQSPKPRIYSAHNVLPDAKLLSRPCFQPLNRLIVHYDGNVALCCDDMKDEFDLGNAFDKGIGEIWFSQKHKAVIRDLLKGRRDKYALCRRCSLDYV